MARLAGRARSTIQVWLDEYTEGGMAQLLEREAPPGLASPVADAKVQEQLQAGLKAGRWRTAGQVAAWLKEAHGIKRATKSVYYWLGKAGGALRVPRPCHVKQDPAAVVAFRGGLEQNLAKLNLPKDRAVKIWVADEGRFGLHTQSRRCWTLRGHRVVMPREQRYEWEYVYGAVEVVEGLAQFRFLPSVSLELTCGFLEQIAQSDPHAEHVVIWDQAGFHPVPGDQRLPARIHLLPLPPYSPELNPVEGLWDQTQDVTSNHHFANLDQLEEALTQALRPFWETRRASSPSCITGSTIKQTLSPNSFYRFLMGNGIIRPRRQRRPGKRLWQRLCSILKRLVRTFFTSRLKRRASS
jgi:transposase